MSVKSSECMVVDMSDSSFEDINEGSGEPYE